MDTTAQPLTPPLYIVFTFDGGTVDHLPIASNFTAQNMSATFLVSTNNIGQTGYLTTTQLQLMRSLGHEIGSKGQTGSNLLYNTTTQILSELCGSRQLLGSLLSCNSVTSLSWPYSATNATLQSLASSCGYTLARSVGGIKTAYSSSCSTCPYSTTIPLSTPLAVPSFSVKSNITMGYLIWQVRQAEQTAIGLKRSLVLNFGTVCQGCAYSPTVLQNFLVWLQPRTVIGTFVKPMSFLEKA
jgi:hypothetical protein